MYPSQSRSLRRSIAFGLAAALSLVLVSTTTRAQAPEIPDLDVSGPAPDFEMSSRLMTSGKRMEAWITVPGQGKVKVSKFNGTFFYRHTNPAASSGTLLFRTDGFENVEGKMGKLLTKELDFKTNPFFAFQSHSATATKNGVDLKGKLIVAEHETDVTLHMRSPGEVTIDPKKKERVLQFKADMEVNASEIGLESIGKLLRFDLDVFLFNYTEESTIATGINSRALDETPPQFPRDASALSNAGWYLMYKNRFDDAIEAFDKSIALAPTSIGAYLRRGDAYAFNGDYGKSVGTFRLMWDIMPVHPHLIEMRKVLSGEYLTAQTLRESNARWHLTQTQR